jgi:hypothetical protein
MSRSGTLTLPPRHSRARTDGDPRTTGSRGAGTSSVLSEEGVAAMLEGTTGTGGTDSAHAEQQRIQMAHNAACEAVRDGGDEPHSSAPSGGLHQAQ